MRQSAALCFHSGRSPQSFYALLWRARWRVPNSNLLTACWLMKLDNIVIGISNKKELGAFIFNFLSNCYA